MDGHMDRQEREGERVGENPGSHGLTWSPCPSPPEKGARTKQTQVLGHCNLPKRPWAPVPQFQHLEPTRGPPAPLQSPALSHF